MAAFRFSLQTVLNLREEEEKKSAVGLAKARIDAGSAQVARENLEAIRDAGRSRLARAHGSGGVVGHLQNLALVVGSVEHRIRHAHDECEKADERVVESMKEFHRAFRDRSSMDRLRTRKLEEWRSEQLKTEQKTMDEVALSRHVRGDRVLDGE